MMKKTIPTKPLFDQDKQKKPLSGEASSEDARVKAAYFAVKEKAMIINKSR